MPLEDYTGYEEVDPNSHIERTANHIDHLAHTDEDAYLYKDKGVDHFGDFEHLVDGKWIAVSSPTGFRPSILWMLANELNDGLYFWGTDNKNFICLTFAQTDAGVKRIYIWMRNGTSRATDYMDCSLGVWYYFTLKRVGSTFTCKVYSDSARTNLLDTLTLTVATTKFRYIYACNTWHGNWGRWSDADIENLDLQEYVPKTVKFHQAMMRVMMMPRSWSMLGAVREVVGGSFIMSPKIIPAFDILQQILLPSSPLRLSIRRPHIKWEVQRPLQGVT